MDRAGRGLAQLAAVQQLAGTDGDHFANDGFPDRRVRNDDPARGPVIPAESFHHDMILQRLDLRWIFTAPTSMKC